jgi:L-asparagine transporter-like permease
MQLERKKKMKKEDMTVPALLLEAMTILLGIAYIILQIYYGIHYHIAVSHFAWNIVAAVLVYVLLTLLECYPQRVHKLPPEAFTADIRKLTLRMLRLVKFVFIASLLVPCLFDIFGVELLEATSLVVVLLIIVIVVWHEYRIIRILQSRRK